MFRANSQTILYILFLLLGGAVTAYVFSEQDLDALGNVLAGTRWEFVALSLGLTLGGHWVRALRWQQLLAGAGHATGPWAAFWALMNGYLVNLGIPRLGEVTRCASLQRQAGVPFAAAAGTVVVERVIDLISLALILGATFLTATGALRQFFEEDVVAPFSEKVAGARFLLLILALAGVVGLAALILFLRSRPQHPWLRTLRDFAQQLKSGLVSFAHMPGRGRFLAYTLLIWASYFSAPFLMIFALDLHPDHALQTGLVAFAVGSIARTIPAPAGAMGPYHWLVSRSVRLFGLTQTEGLALATLNHAVQTVFYLVVGASSFLAWAWTGRKKT